MPRARARRGSAWRTYSLLVDLSSKPEMRYLRIHWNVSRWDDAVQKPVFAFFVSGEQLRARVAGAA